MITLDDRVGVGVLIGIRNHHLLVEIESDRGRIL